MIKDGFFHLRSIFEPDSSPDNPYKKKRKENGKRRRSNLKKSADYRLIYILHPMATTWTTVYLPF